MNKKITFFTILLLLNISIIGNANISNLESYLQLKNNTSTIDYPKAIAVDDSNPFFALIATPIAIRYIEGIRKEIPLYVKNFDNPSDSIERAEKEQIGILADFIISDIYSAKEASLISARIWESSPAAIILKEDKIGYDLGVAATPIASYKNIPIIVTDEIDNEIVNLLNDLGVEELYICGDFNNIGYPSTNFSSVDQIVEYTIKLINEEFGQKPIYFTLTNPIDTRPPKILDSVSYSFDGTLKSGITLPTQALNSIIGDVYAFNEFFIPNDYKYAKIKVDLKNLDYKNSETLGDKLSFIIKSPDGPNYIFGGTQGGIPDRDEKGIIKNDKIHFEVNIYNNSGIDKKYSIQVYGQWFAQKEGRYELNVTVEKLEHPYVPLMEKLSSIAPYLTAYHMGVILAKPDYAFAADDDVIYNGMTCNGVTQPGTNPNLLEPSNAHTLLIHDEINELLASIANIPSDDIPALRQYYNESPVYITLVGDPTMIPMFFYQNPDGDPTDPAYMTGFALPSDFIYGDIDVNESDPQNNTETFWPNQENIVGRITARDIQDASALIVRTIFYNKILENMDDQSWKDNALVQTGCGLEFQNLPIITKLSHILTGHTDEPTKFPSGEGEFINKMLQDKMGDGYNNVKGTFWLKSQREGFTKSQLNLIKKAGIMNLLLFPKGLVNILSSDKKVTGGIDQCNSNLIFTFAHGSYNLFEHGDVFIDARGFPGVTTWARLYPKLRSDLSAKGAYNIRSVDNMKYGPSVIFVQSCITARIDGIVPENALSQAFLHAGVNTYIGATRFTADPGYLPPRPFKNGLGFGILGLTKAIIDLKLKGEFPQAHFGAVIAEDFIVELIENDATTGMALRNAKNLYMIKDANTTFLWTPPLNFNSGIFEVNKLVNSFTSSTSSDRSEGTRDLGKKFVALHEFNIYGDPAFNPYQSINNN
jgi:hypothetical protein